MECCVRAIGVTSDWCRDELAGVCVVRALSRVRCSGSAVSSARGDQKSPGSLLGGGGVSEQNGVKVAFS